MAGKKRAAFECFYSLVQLCLLLRGCFFHPLLRLNCFLFGPIEAEAEAMIYGLKLAARCDWMNITIEVDSIDLWSSCCWKKDSPLNLIIHLKRIYAHMEGIQVCWLFIHRESNKCVDWAMKQGLKSRRVVISNVLPSVLACFVRGDMIDTPFIHVV